eukprot:CAMPEP_0179464020 /NCGR_PEP_ID=MMETSP0799-20121207/45941_1 /TAXON_ID=46947 /ORGANISM="Geminigera cryophila, Strain CCMP2564" /LENGTH=207 /DNA_ID=CAMNT_0021267595 /DNA_START=118 /DNA_END=738 /DNA_ORIENTATION=+
MGAQYERKYGTIAFLYFMMAINVCANVLFSAAALFLAPIFPSLNLLMPSNCANGVWNTVLALLVVQTQRSTQPYMSFWGLCSIPTKIYPWFLLLLFAVLGSSILDHLSALLIGYAFVGGHLARLFPLDARFIGWENWAALEWLTGAPGYLTWTGNLNGAGDGDEGGGLLGNWGSGATGQSQSRTGNVMSGGVIRSGAGASNPTAGTG